MNVTLIVRGVQGHVAYPQLADNPVHTLIRMLSALTAQPLDSGSAHFQPSNLEFTSVDVGNPASNVIPARAEARLNIRFNPLHDAASLKAWIEGEMKQIEQEMGGRIEARFSETAEAFLTEPGDFVALVRKAVAQATGTLPQLSASGGTSDARFIKNYCPVVEFGPTGATIHQVDERIAISELRALKDVYQAVLGHYFRSA